MTAILHIVNKSPYASDALASCLRHMVEGASLLLIEDGVYAALTDGRPAGLLETAGRSRDLYVLEPDLVARGLAGRPLVGAVRTVDYPGFVRLAAEYGATHSWF